MAKIILIEEVQADAVNGMYTTPQGVQELLAEMRRTLNTMTARMEQINKGNTVSCHVGFDDGFDRAFVRVESKG